MCGDCIAVQDNEVKLDGEIEEVSVVQSEAQRSRDEGGRLVFARSS